jgi:hypothetical protein
VIRAKFIEEGLLDESKKLQLNELRSESFEKPLKGDWRSYKVGHVVEFSTRAGKIWKADSRWEVIQVGPAGVLVREIGRFDRKTRREPALLPIQKPTYLDRFDVLRRRKIEIAIGEDIRFGGRITAQHVPGGERYLENGNAGRVAAINPTKRIVTLENGAEVRLAEDERVSHGYVVTTYVSQGQDKHRVNYLLDKLSAAALGSIQDFFVAISRGQVAIKLYTDVKESLRKFIGRNSHRMLAHEALGLVGTAVTTRQVLDQELRQRLARVLPAEQLQQIEAHIGAVHAPAQVATQVTPPVAQQMAPPQEQPRAMAAGF